MWLDIEVPLTRSNRRPLYPAGEHPLWMSWPGAVDVGLSRSLAPRRAGPREENDAVYGQAHRGSRWRRRAMPAARVFCFGDGHLDLQPVLRHGRGRGRYRSGRGRACSWRHPPPQCRRRVPPRPCTWRPPRACSTSAWIPRLQSMDALDPPFWSREPGAQSSAASTAAVSCPHPHPSGRSHLPRRQGRRRRPPSRMRRCIRVVVKSHGSPSAVRLCVPAAGRRRGSTAGVRDGRGRRPALPADAATNTPKRPPQRGKRAPPARRSRSMFPEME